MEQCFHYFFIYFVQVSEESSNSRDVLVDEPVIHDVSPQPSSFSEKRDTKSFGE